MDFDTLLEGDLPQCLIDRLRQVETGVDDGWPFIRDAGRASCANTFPGSRVLRLAMATGGLPIGSGRAL
jgi:hypothetical protein